MDGTFKILQIADMHYENGEQTPCSDIPESWEATCSDLNTTSFVQRLIASEDPDLIVFSGDNIMSGSLDAVASMNAAFAPAIDAGKPWAAVLGNHDQEADLDRLGVIAYASGLPMTLTKLNPGCHVASDCKPVKGNFSINGRQVSQDFRQCVSDGPSEDLPVAFRCGVGASKGPAAAAGAAEQQVGGVSPGLLPVVEGWGNYHLVVNGPLGSKSESRVAAVLYLLDSGDYTKLPDIGKYDWIRPGQQLWMKSVAAQLMALVVDGEDAPIGLAYFHIPVPEFERAWESSAKTGVKQEVVSSAVVNSGFFTAMLETQHIKASFVGHDHINDYCGSFRGMKLCYAGGTGYHAYGKVGWPRRARVVLLRMGEGVVGSERNSQVEEIWSWKRLDDGVGHDGMSDIDRELLWGKGVDVEGSGTSAESGPGTEQDELDMPGYDNAGDMPDGPNEEMHAVGSLGS
ncbi:hypothetical protein CBR_g32012 [Chara braunii]|uniref:Calcineurin-like phosphoesterase domain-containing protein n=1 Tax=Chara braunii TaxID=69332 RepID=A0A388LGB2_CHABU|nr:hypothetical protein CBR_g32012 [Chara braunii]|eukprot:GBG81339.1 hypothetical protein CBR_g32012 [Chara braunii]